MLAPILKQGPFLLASIQEALSDGEWQQLRDNLLAQCGKHRSRGVVVDVTAMDVVDSFACRILRELVQMLKLRGADTVIVGISPDVAFSMVQLGLRMDGVSTALDLEEGMELLQQRFNAADRRHG